MILASGSQIAQVRPNGTSATSAFTADLSTEVTLIIICNTTTAAVNFSLYHDDDGSTFDESTALHFDQSLGADETLYIGTEYGGAGITVKPDGQLGVQTSTASALTFTIYGVTQEIGR